MAAPDRPAVPGRPDRGADHAAPTTMLTNHTIAVIGAGNIGRALIGGMLTARSAHVIATSDLTIHIVQYGSSRISSCIQSVDGKR